MMGGGCAPYRACRSRLAIAGLHMVPFFASACPNTTAGSQAGKPTRVRFQSEPSRREVAAASSADTARPPKWRQRPEVCSLTSTRRPSSVRRLALADMRDMMCRR